MFLERFVESVERRLRELNKMFRELEEELVKELRREFERVEKLHREFERLEEELVKSFEAEKKRLVEALRRGLGRGSYKYFEVVSPDKTLKVKFEKLEYENTSKT